MRSSQTGHEHEREFRLGHPSGVMELSASMHKEEGSWCVEKASAARTARRLMEGDIYVPERFLGGRENAFFWDAKRKRNCGPCNETVESSFGLVHVSYVDRKQW